MVFKLLVAKLTASSKTKYGYMFSIEEYFFGWLFYLLAATGLLTACWRATRWIHCRFYIRWPLQLSGAIILLMPYTVNDDYLHFAPAWIITIIDMLFTETVALGRAGELLLLVWCTALILYFVSVMVYRVSGALPSKNKTTSHSPSIR